MQMNQMMMSQMMNPLFHMNTSLLLGQMLNANTNSLVANPLFGQMLNANATQPAISSVSQSATSVPTHSVTPAPSIGNHLATPQPQSVATHSNLQHESSFTTPLADSTHKRKRSSPIDMENEIKQFNTILDDKENTIIQLTSLLQEKEREAEQLSCLLQEKGDEFVKLSSTIPEKDNEIREISNILYGKESEIGKLDRRLIGKENEIRELKQHIHSLKEELIATTSFGHEDFGKFYVCFTYVMQTHLINIFSTHFIDYQFATLNKKYQAARKMIEDNAVIANNNNTVYRKNMSDMQTLLKEKDAELIAKDAQLEAKDAELIAKDVELQAKGKEPELCATSPEEEVSSILQDIDFDDLSPEKKYLALNLVTIPFNFHLKDLNLEKTMNDLKNTPEFLKYIKASPKVFSDRYFAADYVKLFLKRFPIFGGGKWDDIGTSQLPGGIKQTFLELRTAITLSCIDICSRRMVEFNTRKKALSEATQVECVTTIVKEHFIVLGFAGFQFVYFTQGKQPMLVTGEYEPMTDCMVVDILKIIRNNKLKKSIFHIDRNDQSFCQGLITGMHSTVNVYDAKKTFDKYLKNLIESDEVEQHLYSSVSIDGIVTNAKTAEGTGTTRSANSNENVSY